MRSDDVYEQAARDDETTRDRGAHEAQDRATGRDERLNPDDELARDDQTARDERLAGEDEVTGGDWMARDERAPGDERMGSDDRMPGDDRVTGSEPMLGDDRVTGGERMANGERMADRDELDRDDDELARDERITGRDQIGRDDQLAGGEQVDRDERNIGDQPRGAVPVAGDGADAPLELFGEDDVSRFRDEWREIQSKFVDDPQEAVRGADHLVSEVMDSLTETFNHHKHDLEEQWQHGEDAETEGLRQALRRYRTFFDQLLNA